MLVKGGAIVDPDSGLDHCASVVTDSDGRRLTAVLGLVDLVRGSNSYYKSVDIIAHYLMKVVFLDVVSVFTDFRYCDLMMTHVSTGSSAPGVALERISVVQRWNASFQ